MIDQATNPAWRRNADAAQRFALYRALKASLIEQFRIQRFAVLMLLQSGNLTKSLERKARIADMTQLTRVFQSVRDPIIRAQLGSYVLGQRKSKETTQVDTAFTLRNTAAETYISTVGAERVTMVTDYTKERVKAIIETGMAEGEGIPEIARRLYETGEAGVFSRRRAETIARTETGDAYGAGNYTQVKEDASKLGLEVKKRWILDGNPCPICIGNADEGWIPQDDDFSSGHPCETAHVNCVCAVEYMVV